MRLFSNPSKLSTIGLTLVASLTLLSLAGCDNATDTATTPDSTDTSATAAQTPITTVARIPSDSIDYLLYNPMIASGTLTEEQVACIEERDRTLIATKAQEYYEQNFTAEEMTKLDEFYNTPTGQRFIDYGNEELMRMTRIPVENPMEALSTSEMSEIQAFMETPLGQKYQQINNAQSEGSLSATIKPIATAEIERCQIEGVLPSSS